MPYSRPSLSDLITRIKSDFYSRIEDARTFLRRSFFDVVSKVYAGAAHLLYEYVNYVKDQLFIVSSDQEHLDRHGSELGVQRTSGVKASGTITVSGTVGTIIGKESILISSTNLEYRVSAVSTIGSGGTVSVSVSALKVGISYNLDTGTVISFNPPLSDVNTDATVESPGIADGENQETVEAYRARLLLRKRFPPHGGIKQDYVNWALEVTGVTRAWVVEEYQGIGTIGLAFVRDDDSSIFPDETEREAVKSYIFSHEDPVLGKDVGMPVTAKNGLFMINNQAKTVDMDLDISPNTSAVQSAVTNKVTELINNSGGAQNSISISEFYEAIMSAAGIVKSRINTPSSDSTANANEVHVLGTITFNNY